MLSLFQKKYHHLNKIHISSAALKHNHAQLQQLHPNKAVCHVLKSNAYGHGLKKVAPLFDTFESPFLVVDSLFEGYELQKLHLKTPILILGYTHPENFTVKKLPFHFAVSDIEVARTLNEHQPGCHVHLFVDTGMSREGVALSELPRFLAELKKLHNLKITGLTSHFADADNPESLSFTEGQVQKFHHALSFLKDAGIEPNWRHISASAGALKITDPIFNMVRVGIASYGITPLDEQDPQYQPNFLTPALRFTSTLAQMRTIEKGTKVGYGLTFTAEKEMLLGLVPAGYYEGVDRRLSSKGFFKLHGVFCPIIGRVSMNMTVVDISEVRNARVGDEVEVYSDVAKDKNSISEVAKLAETIPYEILVKISETIRREVL